MRIAPVPAALLAGLLAASCAVGPDYARPETPAAPAAFDGSAAEGIAAGTPDPRWWHGFGDEQLDGLVEAALHHNHDLKIAAANLRASRALLREAGLERFPTVTVEGSALRERRSPAGGFVGVPGVGEPETFYDAGFDATWELDFFGRVRRSVEAYSGDYGAQEAQFRDALVSVSAEVVRTYLDLRGLQTRLAVARDNAVNQEQTYELTLALLRGGRGTDLDIARALAQLETTRAGIPPLEAEVIAAENRLGVLTGQTPEALRTALDEVKPLPRPPERVTVDDPATLLRRRPDVRAAERRLAAAVARQGVAVADYFPRVTLTGTFGYNALELDDIGDDRFQRYSYGPRITWAALDLGRVRARADEADARAEAALASYEQAVLTALEDTENSLARYSRALAAEARLRVAAEASGQAAELARLRYRYGADSFLTVLDAEQRLLEAQDRLAQAQTEVGTTAVAVFKALGIGWEGVATEDPGS